MVSLLSRVRDRFVWMAQQRRSAQQNWDRRWSTEQTMYWETTLIPAVLIRALDDGWIPANASILDIGCGKGHISAELAERGHRVLGCDFSSIAIEKAARNFSQNGLRFEVRDAATEWSAPEVFDVLFDRGCLHCLDPSDVDTYAINAAASVIHGGKLLLIHKRRDGEQLHTQEFIEAKVRTAFEPTFLVEEVQPIDVLDGETGKDDAEIPGLVFWMRRR